METRADPPESAAIWKVLNVCPLCSNLHVLRPFREVHGRFFFSDGKQLLIIHVVDSCMLFGACLR